MACRHLADYEHRRQGASRRFNALLDLDGKPAAYAVYRVKEEWEEGYPRGEVRVAEAFARHSDATRDLALLVQHRPDDAREVRARRSRFRSF